MPPAPISVLQLIAAKGRTGHRREDDIGDRIRGHRERRFCQEAIVRRRLGQQRFDVAPQRLVIGAGRGEKRRAIGR